MAIELIRLLGEVEVAVLPLERQRAPIFAVLAREPLGNLDPRRKRSDARRSSSSGSTSSFRATFTAANSTSPSSSARRSGDEIVLQLAQLVVEVRERALDVGVLEPDRLRALLHLARVQQRGQRLRHVVEDASRPSCSRLIRSQFSFTRPAVSASTSPNTCGCRRTSFSWISRAAVCEIALAALLEQEREEVHLEEQVAELVEQLLVVAGERRVRDLVRLLDRVRHDRARGLLAVPRALATQPLRQALELEQGLLKALQLRSRSSRSCVAAVVVVVASGM